MSNQFLSLSFWVWYISYFLIIKKELPFLVTTGSNLPSLIARTVECSIGRMVLISGSVSLVTLMANFGARVASSQKFCYMYNLFLSYIKQTVVWFCVRTSLFVFFHYLGFYFSCFSSFPLKMFKFEKLFSKPFSR